MSHFFRLPEAPKTSPGDRGREYELVSSSTGPPDTDENGRTHQIRKRTTLGHTRLQTAYRQHTDDTQMLASLPPENGSTIASPGAFVETSAYGIVIETFLDHLAMFCDCYEYWVCEATPFLVGTSCISRMKKRAHKDGDLMIAGFFPLYTLGGEHSISDTSKQEENMSCRFIMKNYQFVLALAFAVEEINKNPDLLPNMTLGFDIYNVDFRARSTLENPFTWLSGQYNIPNYTCMRESNSVAVLTGISGIISAQIGTLLELYKFPQLTYGPLDPVLSDKSKFPSLYQMAPKDTSLAIAMVSLMLHFSWNWVGLLISLDESGLWIIPELREEMAKNRVCVAFEHVIPRTILTQVLNIMTIHRKISKSSANVFIIYGDNEYLLELMTYFGKILMSGKVWLMTSQSDLSISRRYFILGSFHVPLMFSHHHSDISGFKNYVREVNPSKYPEDFYLARLWVLSFNCSHSESDCITWENCPQDASLEWLPGHIFDMAMFEESYNIYNSVYAVVHSLHKMLLHQTKMPLVGNGKGMVPSPAQLHPFLKKIQFYNSAGDKVILGEKEKIEAEYDIVNIWNFPEGLEVKVKVGLFSPYAPHGHQLSIAEDMIEWTIGTTETPHSICSESCGPGFRKSPQEEKAACCFDCIPCLQDEISNGTDMEQCVKCPDHLYANSERNQCLLRAESFLAHGEPLGMVLASMALCFSTLTAAVLGVFVKYQDTPIVKANNRALSYILLTSLIFCFLCSLLFIGRPATVTCILQQVTFGVVFTVAISTVLAKTVTVVLAFKATSPGRRMRWLLVSGAPNFIIPICTLIQVTLYGLWLRISPPFVDTDAHSEHGHIIILCNMGSLTAFYCVLGYLGALALASFTVAFLVRNLPDTFNEAKFLTFSMLVFCSVWLTFLPVYHSAKGKVMVAVEVFSILSSSAGLLGCIFAPKCYIILLKSDRNSLRGFRDKQIHGKMHTLNVAMSSFCVTRAPSLPSTVSWDNFLSLSGHFQMFIEERQYWKDTNVSPYFLPDMEQCVKCPDHQYPNTERNQCFPKAVSFLAHEEPLEMALDCMALCFSTLTALVLGVFVKHQDTPIVKANNQALSYNLLISLTFCFFCSLLPIGHPNTITCILQQVIFGIVFAIAFPQYWPKL
ncbi:vomeronasal type-2 receptor 116-like [Dipodomys spectabilis]|uniref:vomeronasal type-2 receptor 116-like n=1 Tax=Dipodomys spectabilis TaxID=105255 RepID=UPI001C5407D1|nr:vomeronasal type-2 receptor 116-like [Dipodomys spectabilis]